MKNSIRYVLLLATALLLTACGNKLSNGTYVSEDGGAVMVVEDKQVEIDMGLGKVEGTIEKDNKMKVEVSALLVFQAEAIYTYEVKGNKVEVADEKGQVVVFEKQKENK